MNPRSAITAVFFVDGALFATWASRIPALSDRAGAGAGLLGLCLLAPAAAAVISMPLVGRLLPGRSSRAFCQAGVAGLMVAVLLPALALAILLGGGEAKVDDGYNTLLAIRQRQVKEYVQRVRVAGFGERFENGRANPMLEQYVRAN